MSAKAATRKRINLTELATSNGRVDAAEGVIRGVKVLGGSSDNNRVYTRACMESAVPLYEGAKVFADHPEVPSKERPLSALLGYLRNVRMEGDGLRGDLVLIRSHPMANTLLEIAGDDDKSRTVGLSHNAVGETQDRDGRTIVTKLLKVRSVDVVTRPATATSLFESKGGRMADLKEDDAGGYVAPVTDDAGMDAGGADPEGELWKGILAACTAILNDDSMSAKDKAKKIGKYLMSHEKLAGDMDAGGDETEAPVEEDASCAEPEKKDEPMKESVATDPAARVFAALDLCESVKVTPYSALLKALAAVDADTGKALLEGFKASKPAANPPRTQPAGARREPAAPEITDAKSFAAALRNGSN